MTIRFAILLLALTLPCGAAPAVAPQDVRAELCQAMERNAQLYRACIGNIENQFTPGYKTRDIFGFLNSPGRRQLRIRFTQGRLRETGNPYDLAIQGDGFFMLSDGLLTRAGCFRYDPRSGHLCATDSQNRVLMGVPAKGGVEEPILIPRDAVQLEVRTDGQLLWTRLTEEKPEPGYQIRLANVADPTYGLESSGLHFRPTAKAGPIQRGIPGKQGLGVIAQGHLELSNANIYEQRLVAAALRRYAGLVGFPVTGELEDEAPLQPHPDPRLLQLSERTGRSINDLTREAVEHYLKEGREKFPQNLPR